MSDRIRKLEEQLIQQELADDRDGQIERIPENTQVEILESWIRE